MKKLKIGILDFTGLTKTSRTASDTSRKEIRMLKREIVKSGYRPIIYKVEKCQLYYHGSKADMLYNNKLIKACDILIPRISRNNNMALETALIQQFEILGIPLLNDYYAINKGKNKLKTMQVLTQFGIAVPKTIVVRKLNYLDGAIEMLGGYPIILKTAFGSYGSGVAIVESRRSLYSSLDIIWKSIKLNIILIQEYIAEAEGNDYRAFVIDDKVVASMMRSASDGDFRSNLHQGGTAMKVILTKEEKQIAIRATKALGLQIAAVDILRSKNGPVIMEVNANPGFYGLTEITGINVAEKIVKQAVKVAEGYHKGKYAIV